jgi:ABC-type multidrug transport system fused ATPase/permease subunit
MHAASFGYNAAYTTGDDGNGSGSSDGGSSGGSSDVSNGMKSNDAAATPTPVVLQTVSIDAPNPNLSPSPNHNPMPVVLDAISIEVQRGKLTAIIGSVGSGKSTLIHGLLGELYGANPNPNPTPHSYTRTAG